jgi:dihydrofolate reductase
MTTMGGSVLVHRTMSLDGFIAGPEHEMDWIFEHPSPDGAREVMRATGAIVVGRRSFEVGRRDAGKPSGAPYGGAWSGPVFVLTHDPVVPPAGADVVVMAGDIRDAVSAARAVARGKRVELFGADVTRQALAHGLVDEILVHIAPVLLGGGIPFAAGCGRVDLEPLVITRSGPLADLRYRVRR